MNTERIDDIIDTERVNGQIKEVVSNLKQLDESIKSMSRFADIYKGAEGSADARNGLNDMITANQKLQKTQEDLIKSINQYKTLQDQVAALQEKYAKMQSEGAAATANLKDKQREYNQEVQKTAQLTNAAEGSIKQMRAQISLLTAEYDKMSAAQRSTDQGQALKNQIVGQTQALKQLEEGTLRYQRNVGNYTGAISILKEQLNQIKIAIDQNTKSGNQNSATVEQLQREYTLLQEILGQQEHGFKSITMEVRNTERALATMAEQGMQDSEAFKQLQMTVASAHRELNVFTQQQKLLSSTAPGLQSMIVAAKGLGGIYATGAGAAALFANGNEKVEKELSKLMAIMTILQGLNELHELAEKRGAIATVFRTGIQKLWNFVLTGSTKGLQENTIVMGENAVATEATTIATKAATGAMIAMRVALIATGIGALLLLIPAIGHAMVEMGGHAKTAKKGVQELAGAEEELTDALKHSTDEFVKAKKEINDITVAIELARKGVISKKEAVDIYNESLGQAMGQVKSLDQVEQEMSKPERVKAYIDMMMYKAAAAYELEKASKKAAEAEEANLKSATEYSRSWFDVLSTFTASPTIGDAANEERQAQIKGGLERNKKEVVKEAKDQSDFYLKIANELQNKEKELAEKFNLDPFSKRKEDKKSGKKGADMTAEQLKDEQELLKLKAALRKVDLEDQDRYLQQILNDERSSYALRMNALNLHAGIQKEIADNETKAEEAQLNVKLRKIQEIEKKSVASRSEEEKKLLLEKEVVLRQMEVAEANHQSKIYAINAESHNKINELQKKQRDETFNALKDDANGFQKDRDIKILRDEAKAIDALDKKLSDGTISIEKYNKAKQKVQSDATIKQLQSEAGAVQDLIDIYNLFGENTADLEQKSLELHKKIEEAKTKITEDNIQKRENKEKQEHDLQKQLGEKSLALGKELIDGSYVKQFNAIQKQTDANTKLKDAEINRINNSTLSEQDKAAKLAQINAEFQAKQDQLDRQKRNAQLKQAKFDRDFSILKIIEQTAIAVATDNSNPLTAWKVPYDIALGAIEVATVLAKPLPTYASGTNFHKGGLAIVGERGAEIIESPSGELSLTPNSASIMNLERGTKVIKHDQVDEYMHAYMMERTLAMLGRGTGDQTARKLDKLDQTLRWHTSEMKKMLKNQKAPTVIFQDNSRRQEWIRKNVKE